MNFDAMPVIKLEVQSMKASILAHMGVAGSELGEELGKAVDRSVDSYPWEERVEEAVHKILNDSISRYFREEGRQLIEEAAREGLKGLLQQGTES